VLQENGSNGTMFFIPPKDFAELGGNRNLLNKRRMPIKVETNDDHHSLRPIPYNCEYPEHPSFSMVTPFKGMGSPLKFA